MEEYTGIENGWMAGWMFTQIMDQILRIRSGKHIARLRRNYYSSDFLQARHKDDLHDWKEAQCHDYNQPNQGNWERHWHLELPNRLLVLFFFAHCFMTTADQLCDRHINQLENYKTFTQQWRGTFTTFNCGQTYRNVQVEWRSTRHRRWVISLSDPIKNNCKYWTPRSSVVSIGFLSLS